MFFLVSGSAGSGKTTLLQGLRQIPNLHLHDADERFASTGQERCQQLEGWINDALEAQAQGQDFLLAGQSPLGELLACPSAIKLNGIAACLLDCHDHQRIQRLRERGIDPKWPPNQHHFNWASWHRMHAYDPQWEQHVVHTNTPAGHDNQRWTNWQAGDPRWNNYILDTTTLTREQVIQAISDWIAQQRDQVNPLTPQSQWWQ
jgi:hypothetical protein